MSLQLAKSVLRNEVKSLNEGAINPPAKKNKQCWNDAGWKRRTPRQHTLSARMGDTQNPTFLCGGLCQTWPDPATGMFRPWQARTSGLEATEIPGSEYLMTGALKPVTTRELIFLPQSIYIYIYICLSLSLSLSLSPLCRIITPWSYGASSMFVGL